MGTQPTDEYVRDCRITGVRESAMSRARRLAVDCLCAVSGVVGFLFGLTWWKWVLVALPLLIAAGVRRDQPAHSDHSSGGAR